MKYWRLLVLALALTVLVSACKKQTQDNPKDGKTAGATAVKVAVIPKGTTHIFWKSIHAGAEKAGRETGADVIWQGPQKEDDREQQIQVVENFISRGVDAIVLAPLDDVALAAAVENAAAAGIKVVVIDSGLQSDKFESFVATDNKEGGRKAARRLADLLDGKGKVMMMRYAQGSASTENREQGFLDGMKEYAPECELVSTDQYGGATRESAMQTAQNLLNKYKDLDGIFCPNESTTFGMLRALQQADRAGKIKFVGFDSTPELLAALEQDEIHGLTVQDPFNMGYMGVKTAVQALNDKSVEERVDTGSTMITKEKLADPKIRQLLNPDLKKWLNE